MQTGGDLLCSRSPTSAWRNAMIAPRLLTANCTEVLAVAREPVRGSPAVANFAGMLAGAGQRPRFRDKEKKPFGNLDGGAVWLRTTEHFVTRKDVVVCIIVIDKNDEEMFRRRYQA